MVRAATPALPLSLRLVSALCAPTATCSPSPFLLHADSAGGGCWWEIDAARASLAAAAAAARIDCANPGEDGCCWSVRAAGPLSAPCFATGDCRRRGGVDPSGGHLSLFPSGRLLSTSSCRRVAASEPPDAPAARSRRRRSVFSASCWSDTGRACGLRRLPPPLLPPPRPLLPPPPPPLLPPPQPTPKPLSSSASSPEEAKPLSTQCTSSACSLSSPASPCNPYT